MSAGLGAVVGRSGDAQLGSVLLVSPWYKPVVGGVSRVTQVLHENLLQRGVRCHVLIPGVSDELSPRVGERNVWTLDIASYLFGRLSPRAIVASLLRAPRTIRQLKHFIREHDVRVAVVLYPIESVWPFLLLQRALGIRLVASVHGCEIRNASDYPWAFRRLLAYFYRKADAVIVHAVALLEPLEKLAPGVSARTINLTNGVDTSEFCPAPGARERDSGILTLLHVSNFAEVKRTQDIVSAVAELGDFPYRLVMVGEGPERAATEKLARELGVAERTTFVGAKADVRPYLQQADLFLLTSRQESAPLVLIEAMACGVPWVSTPWGAALDRPDGECGRLVPVGRPTVIASTIREMAASRTELQAAGQRARVVAVAEYDIQRYVDRHVALFRQLMQSESPLLHL